MRLEPPPPPLPYPHPMPHLFWVKREKKIIEGRNGGRIGHWLDRGRRKKENFFSSLSPIDLHVASQHNQNLLSGT